jgi:hypothetical protein
LASEKAKKIKKRTAKVPPYIVIYYREYRFCISRSLPDDGRGISRRHYEAFSRKNTLRK